MITHPAAVIAALLCLAAPLSSGQSEPTSAAEPASAPEPKREKPIAKGEKMPAFTLTNEAGEPVTLKSVLADGPAVIVFYRGSWCPYCVKALGSVEESIAEINALGATVLAISPETPDHAVDLRQRLGLSYRLLVDRENRLADRLGLMFTLDEKTVERYRGYGIDLEASNDSEKWQLPIPATFVVDKDGSIRYAWTNEDYTKRAPASAVLEALKSLSE